MKGYKRFLRYLLAINVLFVLVVAFLGYHESRSEGKKIAPASALSAKQTDTTCKNVIPVGKTVGIYVNTDGILVIDTGEVTDMEGRKSEPAKNRLLKGDYIINLNGNTMHTKKQLIKAITECGGETLVFRVKRKEECLEVKVEPVETGVDEYKVGIWVRDDLQGLGTITYVDGDRFGALGHSITDVDTGERLQVSQGDLYAADIFGVERGIAGIPGEIEGMITYQTENVMGYINDNRMYGIFGTTTSQLQGELERETTLPVAEIHEVEEGTAYIQSYISGDKEQYEIAIENIHRNSTGDWEMELLVKDKRLLSLTGGIVQGMSGSPILQNGKLIGAVTHVFVNDPTRGYGIFIEYMLEDK